MGRHKSGINQRSRTPRDRRTVPEERNGPANDLFQFDLRSTD